MPQQNMTSRIKNKRWNRRSSDGAAWGSASDIAENNDIDSSQPRPSYSLSFRRIVASEPLFSREPIQITEEFRSRIAAAARASLTTLITFSLLVYSGQGEIKVRCVGSTSFCCCYHINR